VTDEVPSTSVSLGSLDPRGDDVEKKLKDAADALARLDREERREKEAVEKAEKDRAAHEGALAEARRAPTRFYEQARFQLTALVGVPLASFLIFALIDEPGLRTMAALAFLPWLLALVAMALDAMTWRRGLPFELVGYDVVKGDRVFDGDRLPWYAIDVTVEVEREGVGARTKSPAETREAIRASLERLIAAANKLLDQSDETVDEKQRWRLWKRDGLCGGQSLPTVFTRRVIERWLRNDVARLAAAHKVKRVVVDARTTGASVWVPPGD
jgi:hypothetical protein